MDALILAAGFGNRLRPLTDRLPKALVEVGGVPMLERVGRRLIAAGCDRLIVNVHHHADQVVQFVEERKGFGIDLRISREEDHPLETGGGVLAASPHFRRRDPFFIHNSDILTEIDLGSLYARHVADSAALVTLAVGGRTSARYLIFDNLGLVGYANERTGERKLARETHGTLSNLPFAGIHVADPELLDRISETGVFSIITTYMRLVQEGVRVAPYDIGRALWLEIGTPERLARARAWAAGEIRGD